MTGACQLDEFLDDVAARRPTPGGGAVAAAAGALACAMARMVAEYSPGKGADAGAKKTVAALTEPLGRADRMVRRLIVEDAAAYSALKEAAKRFKADPSTKADHEGALAVAISVPLEIAAVGCEALDIMKRLVPSANRYLLGDLGIATVLAEASVRAAAYMVRVNAGSLGDADRTGQADRQIDRLLERSLETCADIEVALRGRDERLHV